MRIWMFARTASLLAGPFLAGGPGLAQTAPSPDRIGMMIVSNGIDPPVPVRSESRKRQLVVTSGDTLYGLARRHGLPVHRLKAVNGLRNDRIKAGQVLILPDAPRQPTAQFRGAQ